MGCIEAQSDIISAERPLQSRPLRVLELRCADGPGGGPEKTILHGAAIANPDGIRVTVCYIREEADKDSSIRERAEALGVSYQELRQRHKLDPAVWKGVRRLVRDHGIDIVHSHDYKTDFLALLLARRERVCPVATSHGWTGHSARERRFFYPVDKRLLAHFPIVLAVSSEIRSELIRRGVRPERVRVLLNGIDHQACWRDPAHVSISRKRMGFKECEIVLGSVGRVEPQKRFDVLIDAFALLYPDHPNLRLVIAGEGSMRGRLQEDIEQRGLSNVCKLIGHCHEIRDFYHAIDLFVQSSDYEGTPNVVLEAMAHEVPVVATDVGGTSELIASGVHGLIVPPRDPVSLAHAISTTLADRTAAENRVCAARRRVENELSFRTRQRNLESLYRSLPLRYR